MIPLWLAIPCIVVCLIVAILWFMSLDINWEEAFRNAKGIAIDMILITCFVIAILSIVQWFMFGVK